MIFDKNIFNFIVYQIDFGNFIKKETKRSDLLFIEKKNHIVLENFEIKKLLTNNENWFVFLIENSSTDSLLILKVLKKWTVLSDYQEKKLSYVSLFEKFSNNFGMVEILYICESKSFLMMAIEYNKFNNLYNYIYPIKNYKGKSLLTEETIFHIFQQILVILKKVHDNKKILLSIQPENIYFDDERQIKISHLTLNKLNLHMIKKKKKIQFNMEYTSPELITKKIIKKDIDFWHLGILLYECLYGVTPFQQDNDLDTKNMILVSNVFFPPDEIKFINKECKEMICYLLNKDEEVRKNMTVEKIRQFEWFKINCKSIGSFDQIFLTDKTNKIGFKKNINYCRDKIKFI